MSTSPVRLMTGIVNVGVLAPTFPVDQRRNYWRELQCEIAQFLLIGGIRFLEVPGLPRTHFIPAGRISSNRTISSLLRLGVLRMDWRLHSCRRARSFTTRGYGVPLGMRLRRPLGQHSRRLTVGLC
jgi:hypothetical protein